MLKKTLTFLLISILLIVIFNQPVNAHEETLSASISNISVSNITFGMDYNLKIKIEAPEQVKAGESFNLNITLTDSKARINVMNRNLDIDLPLGVVQSIPINIISLELVIEATINVIIDGKAKSNVNKVTFNKEETKQITVTVDRDARDPITIKLPVEVSVKGGVSVSGVGPALISLGTYKLSPEPSESIKVIPVEDITWLILLVVAVIAIVLVLVVYFVFIKRRKAIQKS